MELNREKIVKALEICTDETTEFCTGCPFIENGGCKQSSLLKLALALIRELTEERDQLDLTLAGVMHFVDKWLDGDELKQADEVSRVITMREKTLRIVEKLTEENERLKGALEAEERHYELAMECAKKALAKAKADTVHKMVEIITANYAVSKVHYAKDEEPTITYQLTNWDLRVIEKGLLEDNDGNT